MSKVKSINVSKKLNGLLFPNGDIVYYRYVNIYNKEHHTCNINDETNGFPCTDKDFVIQKAKSLL